MRNPFIDAHVHLNETTLSKLNLFKNVDVKFLSINTDIPFFPSINHQENSVLELKEQFSDKILHITTFQNNYWNTEKWLPDVLSQLQKGIEKGAIGVKIWKNIGMDDKLKDEQGNFVMVDDDRFDPIYEYISKHSLLLLGHQGEPKNCWLPFEEMTMNSDRNYFANHPEFHMVLHPDYPSYEEQMEARDNMLKKHPKMKYVGLHLFSMEWSLNEVAKRLDLFPNSKTDLAERICHVQYQAMHNYEEVRDFFINYQDRVIYGTDVIDDGSFTKEELSNHFQQLWEFHWNFFATNQILTAPEFDGEFRGLDLPAEVVDKIFYYNAIDTYGFKK